ncbi:helix-turn-helix domain-containing protein [Allorhizocola rhizosphaerae]|uniref:helix-turn-helix domain-containing protein n=1 Tax=Allorhizocola rhizosphaerae TaxID=1872709 RepID=UPI000E3DCAEA|nr:helix-turn-helix transcriptional regulator [Allorhizocola rhizosphaerae]
MTKQPNSDSTATPVSKATETFGQRVRARREALGLSQEKLADLCELHWSYVGQIERGRRNLTLHNILILAAGLQVDPAELVQGLPAPKPEERKRTGPA